MQLVFGMHNWPTVPAGTFTWREGPVMAAVANIEIIITGKGSHGAHPDHGIDPIVVSAQIVSAFQSIVARSIDPTESGVVTIGHINGGHTYNVIAETVEMKGTARWFNPVVGDKLEAGVRRLAAGGAARAVAGAARGVPMRNPTMGGEDFAFMLNAKQGSYIMLGGGRGGDDHMVHHPAYDFNDEILPVGASYWATLAEQLLPRQG